MTPARLRLRRRLLVWSTPAAIVALLAAIKLISVVAAGHSAASDFSAGAVSALRRDVATLQIVDVIEPEKTAFAAGTLAVAEGRLDEADAQFSKSLSRSDMTQSCAARVNLELVRETQGDLAVFSGRPDRARERYRAALAIVQSAPNGCFAGNDDPDADRRAVRSDAAARLAAKLAGPDAVPPPAPVQPTAPPPPASPPPAQAPSAPDQQRPVLQLGPGDPVERLRQVLTDAAR